MLCSVENFLSMCDTEDGKSILNFAFLVFFGFHISTLQFHGSLSDNDILCLMMMYFVKIQRISDSLNPCKSPI